LRRDIELKVEELWEKIRRLEVPNAPEGWVPLTIASDDFVLASREKEERVEIKPFRKEGVWVKIWEYLNEKNKLLNEIEKTLRKDPEFDVIVF